MRPSVDEHFNDYKLELNLAKLRTPPEDLAEYRRQCEYWRRSTEEIRKTEQK